MALCACGCGEALPDSLYKGAARQFVHGHNARGVRRVPEPIEEDRGYRTPCLIYQGYIMRNGYGNSGGRLAHVDEWETVHGPVPEGCELDHLCRVRACVREDHLEPVTRLVNIERGVAAKLTRADAAAIRVAVAGGEMQRDVARRFGVSRPRVSMIVHGKAWKEAA